MYSFSFSEAISCQRPDLSDIRLSGTPLKNTYAYNEVITFACSEGYYLIGATSTTCGNSGHFQGTLPTCAGQIRLILIGYDAIIL